MSVLFFVDARADYDDIPPPRNSKKFKLRKQLLFSFATFIISFWYFHDVTFFIILNERKLRYRYLKIPVYNNYETNKIVRLPVSYIDLILWKVNVFSSTL